MSLFPSRKTGKVLLALWGGAGVVVVLAGSVGIPATHAQQNATAAEATIVPDRILILFRANSLPVDADARITAAGGQMVRGVGAVGIAVATPTTTDAATLIRNLRNDSTILDADYDRMVGLIAPTQIAADDTADVSPDMLPHPLPTFSPALPPDFFYTSTPQQWPAKRIGAAGGGIATPPAPPTSDPSDLTL